MLPTKMFFHFLCLFYFSILSSCLIVAQENDKPNLIIMYTDEHNFRTIGAYRDLLRRDQVLKSEMERKRI